MIVFKLIEGTLAHSDVRVEVVMDDMLFPSFSSAKAKTRQVQFGESKSGLFHPGIEPHLILSPAGDAMVRELDVSRITLRLREKQDKKGEGVEDTIAKLQGQTLSTLQRCLVRKPPDSIRLMLTRPSTNQQSSSSRGKKALSAE